MALSLSLFAGLAVFCSIWIPYVRWENRREVTR